jgi:beta-barrel assembly-enhancing protease
MVAHLKRPAVIARLTALLCAVSLVCPPASAQVSLPDLGDASATTISESQERTIGNRIMREVRVDAAYVDDPEIADYISALGSRLLEAAESGTRRDIDFFVVQEETINAFALVGGHIGVHSGLIQVTQTESELAAVIGHEIAHILQKHQARMQAGMGRASVTSLAALALALLAARSGGSNSGQMTEAAMATASAMQIQNMLDYTREHEREADRVGLTLLQRAGFDPRGASGVFERLLRANRLNEFKGAPAYLRTHPLSTERIADMQDRQEKLERGFGMRSSDSFEYRLVKAKLRANSGSGPEAVKIFNALLAERTIMRPREDVYGLAVALKRTRDFEAAWRALAPLREGASHPAFETLAAQIRAAQGRHEEALAIYRAALAASPRYRALVHGYLDELLQAGRPREVIADLDERLRLTHDDARLYELQARAFEASGRRLSQHRAQAEAYFRKGNLGAAVEQLEIAVRSKGSADFYELSSAESRLRELRSQLENERAAEKALKIS